MPTELVPVALVDLGDGTYEGNFTPTSAAGHCLGLTIDGIAVGPTPFHFKVEPSEPVSISLEGQNLRESFRHLPVPLLVTALDAFGNTRPINRRMLTAKVRPPLSDSKKVPVVAAWELKDGSVACEFVPLALGRHQVQVTYGPLAAELVCIVQVEPQIINPSTHQQRG